MLPGNTVSSSPVDQPFLYPRDAFKQRLVGYDYGGVALNDASQGLRVKVWTCTWDGKDFIVSAPDVDPVTIYSDTDVHELDFTMDQGGQPYLAYSKSDGTLIYRYYDATVPGFVVTTLPEKGFNPRCQLDDKRKAAILYSDIILAYMRVRTLYMRVQRDRFGIEYTLGTGIQGLRKIGMGNDYRFLFSLEGDRYNCGCSK